jgi:hypothetical protein
MLAWFLISPNHKVAPVVRTTIPDVAVKLPVSFSDYSIISTRVQVTEILIASKGKRMKVFPGDIRGLGDIVLRPIIRM